LTDGNSDSEPGSEEEGDGLDGDSTFTDIDFDLDEATDLKSTFLFGMLSEKKPVGFSTGDEPLQQRSSAEGLDVER
jgi:hypothetical protein